MVLIINIFTMLAEERKNEMGMMRAIGLKRKGLIKAYIYEGVIYAALSAAVGVFFGLLVSVGIVFIMQNAFRFGGDVVNSFYFTPMSLSLSYVMGFIITISTVYLSTVRISRLNVVRAIRNIPEPPVSRNDRKSFITGILFVSIGLASMLYGINGEQINYALGGLSTITVFMGFITRKWLGDKIAWNISGIITLILWLPNVKIFPSGYNSDLTMFLLSGLFMVGSSLLVVSFNSNAIIYFFTKIIRTKGKYKAVIQTAISYPLKAKMKTALSIFIFALVIFTVTVLSVMTEDVSTQMGNMIEQTSGGYEILAQSKPQTPPGNIWDKINTTGKYVEKDNITDIISFTLSSIRLN